MRTRDIYDISKEVVDRSKDYRKKYATVAAIDGDRVDIVVGNSTTYIRHCKVLGDISVLKIGQTVQILWWENGRPVVTATGTSNFSDLLQRIVALENLISTISQPPGDDPGVSGSSVDLQRVLLLDESSKVTGIFSLDDAGLDLATGAAAAGDAILMGATTFSSDHTFKDDVMYLGLGENKTIFTGKVKLGNGPYGHFRVDRTANDSNDLIAVEGPDSGLALVKDVIGHATQSGTGDAIGLGIAAGNVKSWGCDFDGQSSSGLGYGTKGVGTVTPGSYTDQYSYDSSGFSVHSSVNAWDMSDPLTSDNGDVCADGAAIDPAAVGQGHGEIIYDLGGLWTDIDLTEEYEYYDGDHWMKLSSDGINWTTIHYQRITFAAGTCESRVHQSSDPGSPLPLDARFMKFEASVIPIVGGATRIAWFRIRGTSPDTVSYGNFDGLYTQFRGSTLDIDATNVPSFTVQSCDYETSSGPIEPMWGDRSVWNVGGYAERHASDIFLQEFLHHVPVGAAGDLLIGEDTTGIWSNLAIGNEGEVLTVNTGLPAWEALQAGHVIQDDGVDMTQRLNLNFIGFQLTDDSGNDATKVEPMGEYIEDLTSQVPATGDHYDLTLAVTGTNLAVYWNGVRQIPSTITIDGDGLGFTTSWSATGGDTVVADYNVQELPILEQIALFSVAGFLTAQSATMRIYNITTRTRTISKVFIALNTPSSSGSVRVDVLMDGTSIFATDGDKPTIAASNYTGSTTSINTPTWAPNSYLQIAVDLEGTEAQDLTIHIVYT